jgi:hypothetical protein
MIQVLVAMLCTSCFPAAEPPRGERVHLAGLPPVVLMDAGDEPRRQLRYRLKEGEEFVIRSSVSLSMNAEADGAGDQDSLAVSAQKRELVVVVHVDDDSARFDQIIEETTFDVSPPLMKDFAELSKRTQDAMRGVRYRKRIDSRGRLLISGSELPPAAADLPMLPGMGASMDLARFFAAVPLPAEKVGVGAKWTTVIVPEPAMDADHLPERIVQTYRIDAIRADELHLSVLIEFPATEIVNHPQSGLTSTMRAEGWMTADIIMSLDEPIPRRMTHTGVMRLETTFVRGGKEHASTSRARMEMVSSAERAEPQR